MNPKNISIMIKSRDKISNDFAEPLVLQYGRIGNFEYGYELEDIEDNEVNNLMLDELNYIQDSINCRIYNNKYNDRKLAINGRGNQEVKFGYNNKGDKIQMINYIQQPIGKNTVEKNPLEYYWWGRQENEIKGFKDIFKRTPFFIYISMNNQIVIIQQFK